MATIPAAKAMTGGEMRLARSRAMDSMLCAEGGIILTWINTQAKTRK